MVTYFKLCSTNHCRRVRNFLKQTKNYIWDKFLDRNYTCMFSIYMLLVYILQLSRPITEFNHAASMQSHTHIRWRATLLSSSPGNAVIDGVKLTSACRRVHISRPYILEHQWHTEHSIVLLYFCQSVSTNKYAIFSFLTYNQLADFHEIWQERIVTNTSPPNFYILLSYHR